MLTNRFTTELLTRRRRRRSRVGARRSWLVQRLEPRCVLAADLWLTEAPQDQVWSDADATDRPALVGVTAIRENSSFQFENQAETGEVWARLALFDSQPIELNVQRNHTLILALDPIEVQDLLGANDSVTVQLIYEATHWQVTSSRFKDYETLSVADSQASALQHNAVGVASNDGLSNVDSPDDDNNVPTGDQFADQAQLESFSSGMRLVSALAQTIRVETEVVPANEATGTDPQIAIKVSNVESTTRGLENSASDAWYMFNLHAEDAFSPTEPLTTIPSVNGGAGSDSFPAPDRGSTEGFGGGSGPDVSTVGDDLEMAQPLDGNATPLPESRRDTLDRAPRTQRRALDIRSSGATAWGVPSGTSSRTVTTPESLATQSAIASVYDDEEPTRTQSAWAIEPKPARLQVATFVIKRADRPQTAALTGSTVSSIAKSTSTSPSLTESASAPEREAGAEAIAQVTVQATAQVTAQATELTQLASPSLGMERQFVPAVGDSTRADAGPADSDPVDDEDVAEEHALMAILVDRLLGSPVSLVAILGLTVVARLEPDEVPRKLI